MNRIVIVSTIVTASFLSFNVGADESVDRSMTVRDSDVSQSDTRQRKVDTQVNQDKLENQRRLDASSKDERGRLESNERDVEDSNISAETRLKEGRTVSRESNVASRSSDMEREMNRKSDDSGKNVKDKDDKTLTPMDQGNSEEDRKIVALIRNDVVNHDNLSFYARNSKIIVRDGNVTLRGPVRSNDEVQTIEKIAKQHIAGGKVDNQLEVVPE
jgi:hyperosmotically inducible protein